MTDSKENISELVNFAARNGGNNNDGRISKAYKFQEVSKVLEANERFFSWEGTEIINDLTDHTRTVDIIAGCELTHFSEHLKKCGFNIRHSFESHLAMDPYSELISGSSVFNEGVAKNVIFSQIQIIRPLINKIQKKGGFISETEMNDDLDSLLGALDWSVNKIRESREIKIWLLTHIGYFTPALGFLDYLVPENNYSVGEFLNRYKLRLLDYAKSKPDVFILDVEIAFEREGKAPRNRNNGENRYRIRAFEQLGGHPSKEGGEILAEFFIHQLFCTSKELKRIKCLVVDCDNTLWDGILREDGEEGVKIRRTLFQRLWSLSQRGIPVCLCSKNDPEDEELIIKVIQKYFLLSDCIVTNRINWNPKSENIKSIADELNINVNTIAFFDDSEFERTEVKNSLPEVQVFSDQDILIAPELPIFHQGGNITLESSKRVDMYKSNTKRSKAEKKFGTANFENFLMDCDMRLETRQSNSDELDRIFEIIQRTNQMNATLKRLSLQESNKYFNDKNKTSHIVKLGDKFGDYGIIGTALSRIENETLIIDELALSCRAMGRRVEDALIEELIGYSNDNRLKNIQINVTRTSRNQQIFETLDRVGFKETSNNKDKNIEMDLNIEKRKGRQFAEWFKLDLNIESQID